MTPEHPTSSGWIDLEITASDPGRRRSPPIHRHRHRLPAAGVPPYGHRRGHGGHVGTRGRDPRPGRPLPNRDDNDAHPSRRTARSRCLRLPGRSDLPDLVRSRIRRSRGSRPGAGVSDCDRLRHRFRRVDECHLSHDAYRGPQRGVSVTTTAQCVPADRPCRSGQPGSPRPGQPTEPWSFPVRRAAAWLCSSALRPGAPSRSRLSSTSRTTRPRSCTSPAEDLPRPLP
jgi:hypothetical protein